MSFLLFLGMIYNIYMYNVVVFLLEIPQIV